jgi:formate dehydrogenase subunit delta
MDIHHLVKMANQIGEFFSAYPDAELARQEIAGHLQRFWDPRMRNAICENLAQAEAEGLSPLVAAAVRTLAHPA